MLRKYLGDKKFAYFIWTNGLPELLDGKLGAHVNTQMLQSAVDKALRWCTAAADAICKYEAQPELVQ